MRRCSLWFAMVVLSLPLWLGCGGNPCATLAGRCEKCEESQQPGCKAVVDSGNTKTCEDSLKLFDQTKQCQ
ncbi:MAG: hypothetical protein EP343_28365 [Deltaproteobacteria bacterium]|nr:MAG: hypothetical protein EP343_28365 [Deltaproteobacteria bacterium]